MTWLLPGLGAVLLAAAVVHRVAQLRSEVKLVQAKVQKLEAARWALVREHGRRYVRPKLGAQDR